MLADLEPFVELPGHQCAGDAGDVFRFGYRCKRTGAPLAIVEIPASTVAKFVRLKTSVRVTTDGKVVAEAEIANDHGALGRSSEETSVVQLIEETLHVDNLRMEEASPRELKSLLHELEVSIQRVRAALAAMHAEGLTASISA
ncbi:hypothetical protein [Bradyrhizobium sp. SHOUNA76]|uniref:hypothetical protein n=1 Tax=Bradyrhizobium sp. SHOUNA76 TaxID=2908927 RepID=UPI001FF1961B|nr:hypothetical protein [Bradyrhizobium sp. SHOUNA76]MCJ9700202.1 hypothetical protein [Bradyrhizobium sp. SHOUNA76]